MVGLQSNIASKQVFVLNTDLTKELLCTDLPWIVNIGEIKSGVFEGRK